ncbi:hypothetical protein SAMN04489760_10124 [Syntrophus gentianae]|uniref:Uncharacterized protein n=1 Tax=Syntrophus gentianae TaxID=43775 RepID=A0A1H7U8G8_9BACT|nr:hypothetical protein [Syntrophus gentianae]SEL93015.1 hypothetical protein SAMN04489760_10124 [Syntrophus gentianae]
MPMTRAEFRGYARLSKSTWEGSDIKLVQTRLDECHAAPQIQKPSKLMALQHAIDAWWRNKATLPDSQRSWHKRDAMYMLTDQMEAETRNWTRSAAADLPIADGTRYRIDANTMNDKKIDHCVNQINVQRSGAARLRFADARQTRRLQHGPLSDRLRNADLLTPTVLDGWEGPRQAVNQLTRMQTLQLAVRAVRTVRNLLPLAPFNNQPQGRANPYVDLVTSVGHGMQLVEAISEHLVQEEEDRTQQQADFCFRYAATSAAARAVGGGVCSHLMSVTAGVLTMVAPANTEILLWFSHADHQFCIISVAHGPWVIVDPWPQRSVVTTWGDHCYFPPPQGTRAERVQAERALGQRRTEEENYAKISILTPCETPYGVPGLLKRANKDLLVQLHGNVQAAAPGHPYQHMDSVNPHANIQNIPHLNAAAPREWGHDCK